MKQKKKKVKVKPKKVKKVKKAKVSKGKKIETPTPKPKKVVGNFDDDSDWRLKEIHHDVAKVRKALYELSLNDEGEHDGIEKKIERTFDRISILDDKLTNCIERIDAIGQILDGISTTVSAILNSSTDQDKRARTFLEEISGEMKSRGVTDDDFVKAEKHRQTLNGMADDIKKDTLLYERDAEREKRISEEEKWLERNSWLDEKEEKWLERNRWQDEDDEG